jgi:GLPGLI family protein
MKKFLFALCCLAAYNAMAQQTDPLVIKCAYQFTGTPDTANPALKARDIMVLELGATGSKYYSYYRNLGDSLLNADVANGGNMGTMMQNTSRYHKDKASIVIYKDYTAKETVITEEVGQQYIYKDGLNMQAWEILADTATLLNLNCQKAQTQFRGRTYYAWFANDIAIPNGPWKFDGLPGLILKVWDSQNHYEIVCTGIEKTYNKDIALKNGRDYLKISRQEIMDLKRQRAEDPISFSENYSGGPEVKINVPIEQRKNFRKPFNPMERAND